MKERNQYDPNEIIIRGDIAEIVLYDKQCNEKARTIIDAEDVEKIKGYKWCFGQGYAVTNTGGWFRHIQHLILGIEPSRTRIVDHRDRNPLNNRKSNFRFCTQAENLSNRPKPKNNTSGFKGVRKHRKKWQARIVINQTTTYLGTFKTRLEAAKAYNIACLKYHGEFACLDH